MPFCGFDWKYVLGGGRRECVFSILVEFTFFVEKCVLAFLTGKCIFCGFEGKYFLAGKHIVLVSEENRIFGFGGKTYFAVLAGKHAFWLWRKTAFLRF